MISYGSKDTELCAHKIVIKYYIVLTHKYRYKVIYNQYRNSLCEMLRRLSEYKCVKSTKGEFMADHVHILVLIPAKNNLIFYGIFKR